VGSGEDPFYAFDMLVHNWASLACFQLHFFRPKMPQNRWRLDSPSSPDAWLDLGEGSPWKGIGEGVGREGGLALWLRGINVPVYSLCYHLACIAVEHVSSKRKCVCACVCVGNMQSSG